MQSFAKYMKAICPKPQKKLRIYYLTPGRGAKCREVVTICVGSFRNTEKQANAWCTEKGVMLSSWERV